MGLERSVDRTHVQALGVHPSQRSGTKSRTGGNPVDGSGYRSTRRCMRMVA